MNAREVEFDHQSVRVRDEDLEQANPGDVTGSRGMAQLRKALSDALSVGALERDVIDDSRVVPCRTGCRTKVVRLLFGNAIETHVNLNLSAYAKPVAGERQVWPGHDFESERVTVKGSGALDILGPNEVVIEFGDGHIDLKVVEGCSA